MRHSILIVDDNPDDCAVAAKILWSLGYQADVACDGPTALQFLDEQPYSLAIVDYRLPGTDGIELFRAMRKRRPGLAGMLLTGYMTNEVIDPAFAAGIARVLPKPVDFEELIPIIDEFVGDAA